MTADPKVVKLPEVDELKWRLIAACDDPRMTDHLYPALLTQAGIHKNGCGLVSMVTLALFDYVEAYPEGSKKAYGSLTKLVEALTDDEEVLREAFTIMRASGMIE